MTRAEVFTVLLFCFLATGMAAKLPLNQEALRKTVKSGFRSIEEGILRVITGIFESPVAEKLHRMYVMGLQSMDNVLNLIEDIKTTNCL
nr:uncharacterized protein LOC116948124 isoform X2 [Petromyzon marinus]